MMSARKVETEITSRLVANTAATSA